MKIASLAIVGGPPAVTIPAPCWPVTDEQDVALMEGVVRSGKWSWLGPHERAFCDSFASFVGVPHCLLMANGTVTIQCALQALGVEPGDEVIVPGLTWVATLQAALDIGADAVVADVDPETWCLDPAALEAAVTPRTKAVIPVHLYGCMCDMDAIMGIASRHGLKVVEDVAHQHGSRWRNRGAGSIGDAGSFSFQQSKALTCGEGGAVTCRDRDVFETAFALKHVGWMPDLATPGNRYGHNYRATEMQAVLLRGALRRYPGQAWRREESAAFLREGIDKIGGPLRVAARDPRVTRQSYYGLTMHYDPGKALSIERGHYLAALRAEGFGLGVPYPPVYRHPILNLADRTSPVPFREAGRSRDYGSLNLPVTEGLCGRTGVQLTHQALLGSRDYLSQLLAALGKVNDNLAALREYALRIEAEKGKKS